MYMKEALGRGLQSLIPKKQEKAPKISSAVKKQPLKNNWRKSQKESIFNVEIDKIRPNPHQPRRDTNPDSLRELAVSIREHGILQPLLVTKIEKTSERGRQVEYELVAGERRWRAAKIAKLPHVPVIIKDSAAQEKLELALVENIQRENLNPIEAALAFRQLQDEFKLKHHEIAQKVGKKRTTITNALRLLTLPTEAQEALASRKINDGHGRALLLAKPQARKALLREIINNKLSVRNAEDKARKFVKTDKPYATGPKNSLFKQIEEDLRQVIGRRVSITKRKEVGSLIIEFVDQEELDKLTKHLMNL